MSNSQSIMKKIIFLLLAPVFTFAQIVNFADPNFKAYLLTSSPAVEMAYGTSGYIAIDANGDGEIQLTEAQAITKLYLGPANVTSLSGVQSFSNLTYFGYAGSGVTSLDLSTMASLTEVYLADTPNLHTVNLSGLVSLETFMAFQGGMTNLDLTGLANLKHLDVRETQLTTLDATPCTALIDIRSGTATLTTLNLSGLTNLVTIDNDDSTSIQSINVSGCTALKTMKLERNSMPSLDVSGLPALESIILTSILTISDPMPPISLNASGCTALKEIDSMWGSLGTVNLSGCSALESFIASQNKLTSVDFTGCTALKTLDLSDNQLADVDVSPCHNLINLSLGGNIGLHTLEIKNGSNEHLDLGPAGALTNLHFICADDVDIAWMSTQIFNYADFNSYGFVVNSYCNFTPGESYNTITGTVRYDADGDGCDAGDLAIPLFVGINSVFGQGSTYAYDGNYILYGGAADFTLTPNMENYPYFTVSPASAIVSFADANHNTAMQDFCITANGIHPDLEIVLTPGVPARPGFDAYYGLNFRNKGNQTLSGTITFQYDESTSDFVESAPMADSQSSGSVTFSFTDLHPFENRGYGVWLNINSPTDTPPVNIDDVLHFSASITPVVGDETPEDNQSTLDQVVVGSYDPNDKLCLEGSEVSTSKIGDYLHYVVHFENTGSLAAENVVVKDMIDNTKFDVASLQVISASHPMEARITGNKVEFIFQNIGLAPQADGFVVFKIKTKNTLVNGSTASNNASIYFDYNQPVATNTASTTFSQLGLPGNAFDESVSVYPNPASHAVNVKTGSTISSISAFDIRGRLVAVYGGNGTTATLDISDFTPGIYSLKIATENGLGVKKLVKE